MDAREDRGVSLKAQGRGALGAEQASTVDRVWYVSCELKRPFTLERGWILGRAGGQRVGTWATEDWEGTNGILLGLVGWNSANKSFAVGRHGMCLPLRSCSMKRALLPFKSTPLSHLVTHS